MTGDVRILECTAGALVGVLISPDLDVDRAYIGDKLVQKRFGWVGRRVWEWFWRPYKVSFKHGQFASHFPIYSTFTRLSYIYFWLIFVPHSLIKLFGFFHWSLMYVLQWYGILFLSLPFFCGLAGSDLIHWTLDRLTTEHKV